MATLTLFAACKKSKLETDVRNRVQGKWKLVRITGGIGGLDLSADAWGHTQSYEFKSSGICKYTFDGATTKTTYTVFRALSNTSGADADFVTIAKSKMTYEVSFAHDTLVMAMDAAVDGTSEWYVRE